MSIEWISVCLAGGSLVISLAILILVWRVLVSARRTEETGDERLEMLREQRERLDFMHEERELLLEMLATQKRMMEESEGPLELLAPAVEREERSADEVKQTAAQRWLNWLRRLFRI